MAGKRDDNLLAVLNEISSILTYTLASSICQDFERIGVVTR
jgi:hypothetical protein